MPFNLQTKGFLVGLAVGALVLPRVWGAIASRGSSAN